MEPSNTYYCFSEKGETHLPTIEEVQTFVESGVEPVLFIDSCVCLHIIKVVDYGKKATNINLSRIILLKEYITETRLHISPLFGILELCSKGDSFDERKFWDFKYRIDFFRQIPLKEFKKFKYDFNRDFFIFENSEEKLPILLLPDLQSLLSNSYCASLKIRALSLQGLSKKNSLNSINTFLDWMINDLGLVLGAEYKLAMNIFGGRTEFRKMIGLDCNEKDVKRKILGTCWDIFHSKNTSNRFRIQQMLKENIYAYFLTSDLNLFKMYQNYNLSVIKDGDNGIMPSFLFNSDFDLPHFEESFIYEQNKKIFNIFLERYNKKYTFDLEKVNNLTKQLELENNIISN